MSEISYRPLVKFPVAETQYRQRSRFKASYPKSISLLESELSKLGATNAVVQVDVRPEQFRRDGRPYQDAVWNSPRVVVSCDSVYGPLSYPCDTFDHWQDNVRAIALALEALRGVERYGVTRRGEQYTGWKAIGATSTPTMDSETASVVVANYHGTLSAGEVLRDAKHARTAIRAALAKTHPDVNAGDRSAYDNVDAARSILSAHHGVSL